MTIQTFAALKDYFPKEFELSGNAATIAQLKSTLIGQNADAADLLELCRFAVRDEFVDLDYSISNHDTICIIPPSSGG